MSNEHTLWFSRQGKYVKCRIATDLPETDSEGKAVLLLLWHECSSAAEAELLVRYLNKRHYAAIKAIRKAEYDAGWHDKAGKKQAKATGFSSGMQPRRLNYRKATNV
jgi:hypothetical protein